MVDDFCNAIEFIAFIVFGLFWLIDQIFNDGKFFQSEGEEETESTPHSSIPKPIISQNEQKNKCSQNGCRSLTFRSTDYCWKHQDGKPHVSDGLNANWWEEGGGPS